MYLEDEHEPLVHKYEARGEEIEKLKERLKNALMDLVTNVGSKEVHARQSVPVIEQIKVYIQTELFRTQKFANTQEELEKITKIVFSFNPEF